MTRIGKAREPRAGRRRRTLIATALVGIVVGILLLGGGWKWGWFGGNEKGRTPEVVFDLGGGVELTLCWCPPGTFLMGSPVSEAGRDASEVQHEVTLTQGFWMAKTETTQEQWETVMSGDPGQFTGNRLPVTNVSWDEAKAFAAACTESLQRVGKLTTGREFRLPSEAQWEYACRAGTTTAYCSGNGEAALLRVGWYRGNSVRKSSRVAGWLQRLPVIGDWIPRGAPRWKYKPAGEKEANGFGLQDMHGNVVEWCEDWYGEYEQGSTVDPTGPSDGHFRVIRGGSCVHHAATCRSAWRVGVIPGPPGISQGFRVCLVPGPPGEEAEN